MPVDEVRMLYAGAVNYADAAQIIVSYSAAQPREGLILPTHTLMGLAIELLFKAVYVSRKGDSKGLKDQKVRHNLVALRDLAREQGFNSKVTQIDAIVDVIADNYGAHEYRYMKSGGIIHFVQGTPPALAIQAFADEVAFEVGLPIRPR